MELDSSGRKSYMNFESKFSGFFQKEQEKQDLGFKVKFKCLKCDQSR